MKTNFSLKNRIVIAFTIQTLLIAVIAYTTLNLYVDYIEESLLYDHLSNYLDAYIDGVDKNKEPLVSADIKIFNSDHQSLPEFAKHLGQGGHEVVLESGSAYHVLNKTIDSRAFTLIKDQTDFEQNEANINMLTLFVLLLFSLVSFLFSRSLADKIVRPVVNLAEKVTILNVDNFNNIKLDYPDDEIGLLVKVIYEHIVTLNQYLQREKWFTGDISHELRTPMMIISSSMDLLKLDSTTHEQQTQIYQRIDDAVENVNELINTFLLLARGRVENTNAPEMFDLTLLTQNVIDNLESYSAGKNIHFRVNAESEEKRPINSALFSIVLTNLVKNSILNTDEGEISVTLQSDGFVVCDSGKGLTDVIKQFINGSEIVIAPGSRHNQGLGLSIVKRVCEREKWKIISCDGDNGGACFMVYF